MWTLREIPRLLELYQNGRLKLQELVTTTYSLDDVDQGHADMWSGQNIRGVITF
jgi:S-(hydroxymethyl)glutathione dehydrogenase/alcohol dehydrogenase